MSQYKTYLMTLSLTALLVPNLAQADQAEALRDAILICDTAAVQDLLAAGAHVGFSTRAGGINHIALAQEGCQEALTLLKPAFLRQGDQALRQFRTGRY